MNLFRGQILSPDWGWSRPWHRVKVDSDIGLPMLHVLESTLESTYGEVIAISGIGSHTPCFSLDSASGFVKDSQFLKKLCSFAPRYSLEKCGLSCPQGCSVRSNVPQIKRGLHLYFPVYISFVFWKTLKLHLRKFYWCRWLAEAFGTSKGFIKSSEVWKKLSSSVSSEGCRCQKEAWSLQKALYTIVSVIKEKVA